jgi:Restriction endonuclease/HB1, ASXL, restriction endonuclease HTH domain
MSSSGLSFADAAERVLREHSKGAPMHYRRITQLALSEGLIASQGQTPEASLNAAMTQDLKRRDAAGRDQRFRAHGRGMYGLALPTDPLGGAIEKKNAEARARLRAVLSDLDPVLFERLIGELLVALGFEDVEVTSYSNDGGIDLRARLAVGGVTDVKTAIQVKRWGKNVAPRVVRELRGGLGPHERGLIVTLSDFSKEARAEASASDRSPISLIHGGHLIELLIDNNIGATRRPVTILELDEAAFAPTVEDAPEYPSAIEVPGTGQPLRGRRTRTDKVLSTWPLPGGRLSWKATLDRMLAFVASEAPRMPDAIKWLISSYDRVSKETVARSYWRVLRVFGLIESQGEQLAATAVGAEYLADPTPARLFALAESNVAGFSEIMAALREGPRTTAELLALINDSLGFAWETEAQVRFRLYWLENLGMAKGQGDIWEASASEDSVGHS